MSTNNKFNLIYATFPTLDVAESIGGALVDAGLVACVNILPGMVSIYHWQGSRHRDQEVAMLMKTRAALVDNAIAEAKRLHPYDTPALLVLPIEGGSADFLAWIEGQTTG